MPSDQQSNISSQTLNETMQQILASEPGEGRFGNLYNQVRHPLLTVLSYICFAPRSAPPSVELHCDAVDFAQPFSASSHR